jgi:ferric-dicitrate binding protein FerR (iron transport regulator)
MESTPHADIAVFRADAHRIDERSAAHARRRAARWHRWLKSPQCTLQDRENFERWCSDPTNAAAYVALCGDLAEGPELAAEADESGLDAAFLSRPPFRLPRLEADPY